MNAAPAQPAIRRRRLVQVVELPYFYEPRFIHSLPAIEVVRLLDGRSRLVKSDETPPSGAAWYAIVNAPGLGARLRLWPFALGSERDEWLFWWHAVKGSGRDGLTLLGAAPESIREQLARARARQQLALARARHRKQAASAA